MQLHHYTKLQVERRREDDTPSEPLNVDALTTTKPATGGEEREFIEANPSVCAHHTPATVVERR